MANQPKTPVRHFRIEDEIYQPALAKARRQDIPLTAVVRDALKRYIEEGDNYGVDNR